MNIQRHTPVSATMPVSAVQPAIKKADPREVAFGAGVPAASGNVAGTRPADGHARLDAFSQKVEKRLDSAISAEGTSPRQKLALEQERDRFHSLVARFESAYMDGPDGAKMDKAAGMQKLIEDFSKSVNHIMSGGQPGTPEKTPRAKDPSNVAQDTGRRGGIDLVG